MKKIVPRLGDIFLLRPNLVFYVTPSLHDTKDSIRGVDKREKKEARKEKRRPVKVEQVIATQQSETRKTIWLDQEGRAGESTDVGVQDAQG
jgi:hypothetical protein